MAAPVRLNININTIYKKIKCRLEKMFITYYYYNKNNYYDSQGNRKR